LISQKNTGGIDNFGVRQRLSGGAESEAGCCRLLHIIRIETKAQAFDSALAESKIRPGFAGQELAQSKDSLK
jgi:hypothetical protein